MRLLREGDYQEGSVSEEYRLPIFMRARCNRSKVKLLKKGKPNPAPVQKVIKAVASRLGDEASKYTTFQIASLRYDLLSLAKLVEAQYRVVSPVSNQLGCCM